MADERLRVLLIDDDEDDALIARRQLGSGFQVEWQPQVDLALAEMAQNRQDAYLVDYRLGATDGLSVVEEAIRRGCKRPIAVLSGMENLGELARARGAVACFSKGRLRPDEVRAALAPPITDFNVEQAKFLSVLLHDLRSPLNAVLGHLELVEEQLPEDIDPGVRQSLERIGRGAERIQGLLQALSGYTQVDLQTLRVQPVDLRYSVVRACQTLRLPPDGVRSGALPTVQGDPTLIESLFVCLFDNAFKFKREDPVRVDVSARPEGAGWRIEVRDNGLGIDPKHHTRVFQPMERLHARTAYPGYGLGLATARRIIARLGGTIGLESTPGQGTMIFFTLPG